MTDKRWRFMSDIHPDPPHRACDERIAHLEAEMEELSRQLWEMATRAGERDAEIRNLRAGDEKGVGNVLVPVWWCRTHDSAELDEPSLVAVCEKGSDGDDPTCVFVQLSIQSSDENE